METKYSFCNIKDMEKNRNLNNQILVRFGKKIRALRTEKGMTQEEMAERADFSRSYYTEIETGKRNVSLLNLYKLAKALEIPLSRLVNFDEEEEE